MANAASKDSVRAEMRSPDFRKAVKRLETIPAKKSKQQEYAKAIGDVYNSTEAVNGVCKAASQIYMKLRNQDESDRLTIMRDLNGLLDATDWPKEGADLVDKAQGKVVHLRAGKATEPEEDEDDDDVEDDTDVNDTGDTIDEEFDTGDDDDSDANGFTEMSQEELDERKRIAQEMFAAGGEAGE